MCRHDDRVCYDGDESTNAADLSPCVGDRPCAVPTHRHLLVHRSATPCAPFDSSSVRRRVRDSAARASRVRRTFTSSACASLRLYLRAHARPASCGRQTRVDLGAVRADASSLATRTMANRPASPVLPAPASAKRQRTSSHGPSDHDDSGELSRFAAEAPDDILLVSRRKIERADRAGLLRAARSSLAARARSDVQGSAAACVHADDWCRAVERGVRAHVCRGELSASTERASDESNGYRRLGLGPRLLALARCG